MSLDHVILYDGSLKNSMVSGGFLIPDIDGLMAKGPAVKLPNAESFAQLAQSALERGVFTQADLNKVEDAAKRLNILASDSNAKMHVMTVMGMIYLYDIYRLLGTPIIGRKKYNLSTQQMLLARQRAVILANLLSSMTDPVWQTFIKMIYDIFHIKRGVTKKEQMEALVDPQTPYSSVNEELLPQLNPAGYGKGRNLIPWGKEWGELSPELIAHSAGLLNKVLKSGVTLDPVSLSQALQGVVPEDEVATLANMAALSDATKKRRKKKQSDDDDDIVYPDLGSTDDDDDDDDIVYPSLAPRKKRSRKRVADVDDIVYPTTRRLKKEVAGKASKRLKKGSPEARARMAALRAMRKKKTGGKKRKVGGSAIWDSYFAKVYGYDPKRSDYEPQLIWTKK